MLTGDNKETAQKIASALNIPEFRAELKPEDKAEIVKEYQKKAGVLFIGDGVNDAPALKQSDIGVALQLLQLVLRLEQELRLLSVPLMSS